MGQEQFCDFCRADIPIPESIKEIVIGTTKIGDACIGCASALETSFKKQIAETNAKFKASTAPAPVVPAAPGAAAPEQPEQPTPPTEGVPANAQAPPHPSVSPEQMQHRQAQAKAKNVPTEPQR